MSNTCGNVFRFTIFGQSHASAIGVTMEGLPAGIRIDFEKLQRFLDRRAPGQKGTTPRKEADRPEFIAGLVNGVTCGAPVTAIIRNENTRSGDYDELRYIPRPGHADYTAWVKFGEARDHAGGGQFSGRLTAPLCIAGGICLQQLEGMGISVSARLVSVGEETDPDKFLNCVEAARAEGDSVGGVIECTVTGCPAGLGGPMFDGMENRIARAIFGIPGVKGIEFGSGFAGAHRRGSENNDPYCIENGAVRTRTNNAGGILGGLSSGMPIVFRAALKPTPSIAKPQDSVDLRTMTETTLSVRGRHDPCIALRAVPCVEAAAAAAIYDAILEEQ
jgi:Chorismate synthase